MLSIIMPVLDQAPGLTASLAALQPLRQRGHELLVVDGGSRDGSVTIARKYADRVLLSGSGRALQMNAGSESASHDILLFLPVAMRLPENADALIIEALQQKAAIWGFFKVRFHNGTLGLRALTALRNWLGMATLDQAIFVHRHSFERIKGFDNLLVKEDIALCRKLLTLQSPLQLSIPVLGAGRP